EGTPRISCGLDKGGRSVGSLFRDAVQYRAALPSQVEVRQRADASGRQGDAILPCERLDDALLCGAVGDKGPRRLQVTSDRQVQAEHNLHAGRGLVFDDASVGVVSAQEYTKA